MLTDLRILLVEDNKLNVMVAQVELENAIPGVMIDVAVNGQVALDRLLEKDYDLILMDVQMPVMDGYGATRAIRALKSDKAHIPILAMTANVMQAEVQQCLDAGMDGFVPKPFKQEELVEAIRKAVLATKGGSAR
ncbi:MAG: response regulator [Flavobacteriales bacterium]|nr:response regulator [Flavobacteriales bacterium]